MSKTILTIDELVKFCETNNFQYFSSSESGYELAVKIPATFEVDNSKNENCRGMMRVKYKLFHTGKNRNGSNVPEDSAKESLPTIAHRPVLAHIHQLDNGEWDFHSHDMEVVKNDDGEQEIHYIESQVGAFSGYPDEQPYIAHDEETDKDFVYAYAYIPEEYTKTAEILERKGGSKNSVELHIEEMSYDAKEKTLNLNKFYVSGSTLLGSEPDGTEIGEGMLGSRADIADFKAQPHTFEANTELIKVLENLNETLSRFNINDNLGKEVQEVKKKEFEATQVTLEGFEADPEGEEGQETGQTTTEGDNAGSTEGDSTEGNNTEGGSTETGATETDTTVGDDPEPLSPAINDDDPDILKKIDYSIKINDNVTREFSLSVSEKMRAIYELVDATYGEEDWYSLEVYDEEKYLEMYGWLTGKNYRQSYEENDGQYSLVGDRTEIFCMYVTAEQKDALEQMKSEFSEVKEKLRKYEEEPQKMEILNSEDYSKVFSTKEFEELKLQESHFDMSIDEVKAKADSILLDYAKHSNFNLQSEDNVQSNFVQIPIVQKKVGRYGTLFSSNKN